MDIVPITYALNNSYGVITLTTPATGMQIWTEGACWIKPYSVADGAPSTPFSSPAPAAGQVATGWIHLIAGDGVLPVGFDPPPDDPVANSSVAATAQIKYLAVWSEVATGYLKIWPSRA